ncbi:MAG: indolepyruvate oxidoreductase subunit beta [Terriglobales bacterium]|jgi:indolepyruvate ferredoxin oxidoreductase, beta subunit
MSCSRVTNVVIAGLGGQGVLRASDILADVAFAAGLDVKKSEVHGMSQRGGSVASDVRFGEHVYSPMVPEGEADYLVVVSSDQVPVNRHILKSSGTLIEPGQFNLEHLRNKKSVNVALLGALSRHLEFSGDVWMEALRRNFPEKLLQPNIDAFHLGSRAESSPE